MKTLRDFRRFIQTKLTEGNAHEVRDALRESLPALHEAFREAFKHLSLPKMRAALDADPDDDETFCRRALHSIDGAIDDLRTRKNASRDTDAETMAVAVAKKATWNERGDAVTIDLPTLLGALPARLSSITFLTEHFDVSIRTGLLLDLRGLRKPDAIAWLDRKGLHIRWAHGRGGFNLTDQTHMPTTRVKKQREKKEPVGHAFIHLPRILIALPVARPVDCKIASSGIG